jgi:hypothetical protein
MKKRMALVLLMVSSFFLIAGSGAPAASKSCDVDGDGYISVYDGGDDCDDFNPWIHPNAEEVCNDGVDNDCDGDVDFDERRRECESYGYIWLYDVCLCWIT